ncbi:type II toxin-antitoxin system Phd/YefM family antitoxin [candidate division KSB1 bacterium]|nr:type II toxin-antitoxin system Phd/YefM family antitoxin [candidate division KSB1 bacterium]MBL7095325.1 type II toxin-antitoxin system Phd/YefM family antitoxin [candidate division KSB1 bacterium]
MITITATKLRNNLFNYLDKVVDGETIKIYRNKKEVAKLVPPKTSNWRDRVTITPKLLVDPDELIKPIEDIWEDYI